MGKKVAHCRRLETLTEYVLVSQDKVMVEHYARQGDAHDQWVLTEISKPGDILRLASIGCNVALSDIYDKVEFPTDENILADS